MDNEPANPTITDPDEKALEALASKLLGGSDQDEGQWGMNQPQHQDGYNPLADFMTKEGGAPAEGEGSPAEGGEGSPQPKGAEGGEETAPASNPDETEFENTRQASLKKELKALEKQSYDDMDYDLNSRFKKRQPTEEYLQETEGLSEEESSARLNKFKSDAKARINQIKDTRAMLKQNEIKVQTDFAEFDDKTEGNKAFNPTLHELATRMDRQYRSLSPDETTGEAFEANNPYGIYKGVSDAYKMGLEAGKKSGFQQGQQKKAESMSQIKSQPSGATPNPKKAASGGRSLAQNLLLEALKEDSQENRYGIGTLG